MVYSFFSSATNELEWSQINHSGEGALVVAETLMCYPLYIKLYWLRHRPYYTAGIMRKEEFNMKKKVPLRRRIKYFFCLHYSGEISKRNISRGRQGIAFSSRLHGRQKAWFSKCFLTTWKCKFLQFEKRFLKAPTSRWISVDGKPTLSWK